LIFEEDAPMLFAAHLFCRGEINAVKVELICPGILLKWLM
jgi:hypothetical protein